MVMHEPLMSVYARGDGGRVENTQLMARSTEAASQKGEIFQIQISFHVFRRRPGGRGT